MTQAIVPSHYSFGDNDLAAARLQLLAATYEWISAEFLDRYLPERPGVLMDLGAGLGYTTALLSRLRQNARVFGLERSTKYIGAAQALHPQLAFLEHDVLCQDFPAKDADGIYSRFLLTHLHEPERAVNLWMNQLRPKGTLLLEEVAHLASPIDVVQTYYAMVAQMQRHYGQELYIGRKLSGFARRSGHTVILAQQHSFPICGATMARLHAMNISTWKRDPYMSQEYASSKLERLEQGLIELSNCPTPVAPVTCTMAQVVLQA